MLSFTILDDISTLFLMELMFICPLTTLFTLIFRIFFKVSNETLFTITFDCFKSFRGFYWF